MRALLWITPACLLVATAAWATPTLNPANGHVYDYVPGSFSFEQARMAAASDTFAGVPGHLVTITSQGENDFLTTTFLQPGTADFAWIAGSDEASEAVWIWVAGPESGVQFSLDSTPTPPNNFAPWGGPEPNNDGGGEHFAALHIGDVPQPFTGIQPGEWGDTMGGVQGYIVEFGPLPVPALPAAWLGIAALALVTATGLRSRDSR